MTSKNVLFMARKLSPIGVATCGSENRACKLCVTYNMGIYSKDCTKILILTDDARLIFISPC